MKNFPIGSSARLGRRLRTDALREQCCQGCAGILFQPVGFHWDPMWLQFGAVCGCCLWRPSDPNGAVLSCWPSFRGTCVGLQPRGGGCDSFSVFCYSFMKLELFLFLLRTLQVMSENRVSIENGEKTSRLQESHKQKQNGKLTCSTPQKYTQMHVCTCVCTSNYIAQAGKAAVSAYLAHSKSTLAIHPQHWYWVS